MLSPKQINQKQKWLQEFLTRIESWLQVNWKGQKAYYGIVKELTDPVLWELLEKEMKAAGWEITKNYVDDMWSEQDENGNRRQVPVLMINEICQPLSKSLNP